MSVARSSQATTALTCRHSLLLLHQLDRQLEMWTSRKGNGATFDSWERLGKRHQTHSISVRGKVCANTQWFVLASSFFPSLLQHCIRAFIEGSELHLNHQHQLGQTSFHACCHRAALIPTRSRAHLRRQCMLGCRLQKMVILMLWSCSFSCTAL